MIYQLDTKTERVVLYHTVEAKQDQVCQNIDFWLEIGRFL